MVGGAKRRAFVAAATAVAAMALAAAVAGRDCSGGDRDPTQVVRAFASAARAGDREALFALLSPASQQLLRDNAARAELLGASHLDALDLLQPSEGADQTLQLRLLRRQGDRAVVAVKREDGTEREVWLVRIEGQWRISLEGADAQAPDWRAIRE